MAGENLLRSKSTRSLQSVAVVEVPKERNGKGTPGTNASSYNDKGSSIAASVFNLVKSIIGVGILALPSGIAAFSDSRIALLPSCTALILLGLLSAYSFSSIGRACAITDSTTLPEAWYKLVNPGTAKVIAFIITFKTFLTCLVFSMVLGDSFSDIAASFGLSKLLLFQSRTNTILTITLLGILPLCCQKNLDALKYSSLFGMSGVIYCAAFMVYRYLDGSYVEGGKFFPLIAESMQPSFDVAGPKAFFIVFGLLSMLNTAFNAHYSTPRFYNELKQRSMERFNIVTMTGFGITLLLNLTVMLFGFLTFGGNSTGFILNNYASSDALATLARLAIGLGVLCSYPLTFTPLRDGLYDIAGIVDTERRDRLTFPVTIAVVTIIATLALQLDNVGTAIEFSGALISSTLVYLIPALMNIAAIHREATSTPADQRISLLITSCFRGNSFNRGQWLLIFGNIIMAMVGMVIAVIGVNVALFASE